MPRVAIVSRDADERLAIARAFDDAPPSWEVELHERPPSVADVVVYGAGEEAGGGIRFDPAAPRALIDAVRRALERHPGCVVVTSAAGGTGVTSLSLHLSASLASYAPCVFVDLDVRGGAPERLGLDPARLRTWADVETDGDLQRCALPMAGGFRALFAPRDEGTDVACLLENAGKCFEHLIVDVPSGPHQQSALTVADVVVLVVVPALPAAHRARALLESLPVGLCCAVVVNRLGPGGETTAAELRKVLGRPISLELPCCPALRDAEDRGRLLSSPLYRWRRAVARLARTLVTS